MTNNQSPLTHPVSVPKRDLHRSHVPEPLFSRQRRGRKLAIRLGKETQPSTLEGGEGGSATPNQGLRKGNLIPQSLLPLISSKVLRFPNSRLSPWFLQKRPPVVLRQVAARQVGAWRWSLLWLSVFSILGISLASALWLLTQLPPPVNCQRTSGVSPEGDRLYCAQLAAQSGKLDQLVVAIKLVQNWSSNHPLYSEAQRILQESSQTILEIAQQKLNQGNQSQAVELAGQIPVSSPLYPEAQAAIATWLHQGQQGEDLIRQFQEALQKQNWFEASQLIATLSQNGWQYLSVSQIDSLTKQLTAEKKAWQQLQEARDLAKTNQVEQLLAAIARTAQISPHSYAKAPAQGEQSRWSRTLIQIAATRFKNQDFAGVIKLLQRIPPNTPLERETQDWIRLAHACQRAKENHFLAIVDALATVRQIVRRDGGANRGLADNSVYGLAAKQAALWQSQLQDQAKLKFAEAYASFEQRITLEMAIDQGTQIPSGRPERVLAQTRITQWRQEITAIEARNQLERAQQLASGGTMSQLKAAVQIASQVQPTEPQHQTQNSTNNRFHARRAVQPTTNNQEPGAAPIAKWNRQIQTLEDQPILDLANTFAQRRDWMTAISTAAQIRPGRALYSEAQKAIAQWTAQVQTAQDRPILEAATALAAQGRFSAAIATAAQIPPQRALYPQAQAAIARWTAQKAQRQ